TISVTIRPVVALGDGAAVRARLELGGIHAWEFPPLVEPDDLEVVGGSLRNPREKDLHERVLAGAHHVHLTDHVRETGAARPPIEGNRLARVAWKDPGLGSELGDPLQGGVEQMRALARLLGAGREVRPADGAREER